jgi:tetratricopeptide (TPR) repeat protein
VTSRKLFEHSAVQAAALALLVLLAWSNSYSTSFHFDDYHALSDRYVAAPGLGLEIFRPGQTRPLTYYSFHLNYLAGGMDPYAYHVVNVLLHLANTLLLLAIARRHLAPLTAGLAAALFALHPIQTESVTYIFARSSVLAASFALLCFWFFLRDRLAISACFFGLSLLAKEETIALPAFLALYDYARQRRLRWGYYGALLAFAALAAARLFYLLETVPDAQAGFRLRNVPAHLYALTQFRVLWIYLRLLLFPAGLNLDHDVALSQGLLSPWTTLPAMLGILGLVAGLGWMLWKKRSRPALWALGFLVLLAPSSSFVPQADLIFEHRTYYPLTSLVIVAAAALAAGLHRLPRAAIWAAVTILLAALSAGVWKRNRVWHDEKTLWTDVLAKSPNKARPYLGLGRALAAEDPQRAKELMERGLQLDPNFADLQTNLGVVLMRLDDPRAALERFQKAMAITGPSAEHWNNIGAAQFRMGDPHAAQSSYRAALSLDPCFANARLNLMHALDAQGGRAEAWRTGEIPTGCRLAAASASRIEEYRKNLKQ